MMMKIVLLIVNTITQIKNKNEYIEAIPLGNVEDMYYKKMEAPVSTVLLLKWKIIIMPRLIH